MVLNQRIAQIIEFSDVIRLTISGEKIGPCRLLTTSGSFATLSESLRPISVDSVHPKRLHPLNKNGDSYNLKAGISEFGDFDFHATSFNQISLVFRFKIRIHLANYLERLETALITIIYLPFMQDLLRNRHRTARFIGHSHPPSTCLWMHRPCCGDGSTRRSRAIQSSIPAGAPSL
jgi:hypothetical protein